MHRSNLSAFVLALTLPLGAVCVSAQSAPDARDIDGYEGLHAAAHDGDLSRLGALLAAGADPEIRDRSDRTPLHVAAFASRDAVVERLAMAGADLDALEAQAYDIVTIAAVADDRQLLDVALGLGASAGNITSPYAGTALIAAAHLGHSDVVRRLIVAKAPLDHVNNLGWTALMEAIVLGDGGPNHVATVAALVSAGADTRLADRRGITPLAHARERGYHEIVELLEQPR